MTTKTQELKERIEAVCRLAESALKEAPEQTHAEVTARAVLHLSKVVEELVRLERIRDIVAELSSQRNKGKG